MSNHDLALLYVLFMGCVVLVWTFIVLLNDNKNERLRAENKTRKKEKKRLKKLQAANALQNSNELNPQT